MLVWVSVPRYEQPFILRNPTQQTHTHRLSAAKRCGFTVRLIGYLQHVELNPVCCALGDIPIWTSPWLPVNLSFEYLIPYIFAVRFDAYYK